MATNAEPADVTVPYAFVEAVWDLLVNRQAGSGPNWSSAKRGIWDALADAETLLSLELRRRVRQGDEPPEVEHARHFGLLVHLAGAHSKIVAPETPEHRVHEIHRLLHEAGLDHELDALSLDGRAAVRTALETAGEPTITES